MKYTITPCKDHFIAKNIEGMVVVDGVEEVFSISSSFDDVYNWRHFYSHITTHGVNYLFPSKTNLKTFEMAEYIYNHFEDIMKIFTIEELHSMLKGVNHDIIEYKTLVYNHLKSYHQKIILDKALKNVKITKEKKRKM